MKKLESVGQHLCVCEYHNRWKSLNLVFYIIGIFLGCSFILLSDVWLIFFGCSLSLGSAYLFLRLLFFKSLTIYKNKIVEDMLFFPSISMNVEEIIAKRINGIFGGFLIIEKEGSILQNRIIIELGLLQKNNIKDLEKSLEKLGLMNSKCKLNDLIKN